MQCCVQGDMIDESIPIAVDTYEDAGCPWQEWIQSHLNVGSDYWLSDLRSPTPHRPDCFGELTSLKASGET